MAFDHISAIHRLATSTISRRLLPALIGLGAWPHVDAERAAAKKKGKKKTTLCVDGQTIEAAKKKKKKLLKGGAALGACPSVCSAVCAGKPCGADDGCGGICGCAAGSVCHEGACQACTVTCGNSATACGAALTDALAQGGSIFACPGRYVGNFQFTKGVILVGAGSGDDAATSTILDANGISRVISVDPGVTAGLHRLRITGGAPGSNGGGISNGGTLTLKACTLAKNGSANGLGGAMYNFNSATLESCTVTGNSAFGSGAGVFNTFTGNLIVRGTAISDNFAILGSGGGIYNENTVTLDSASSVTGNKAKLAGGGIYNDDGDSVTLNGATVSGNTAESDAQCRNVPGC